jgi:hypothetical protein
MLNSAALLANLRNFKPKLSTPAETNLFTQSLRSRRVTARKGRRNVCRILVPKFHGNTQLYIPGVNARIILKTVCASLDRIASIGSCQQEVELQGLWQPRDVLLSSATSSFRSLLLLWQPRNVLLSSATSSFRSLLLLWHPRNVLLSSATSSFRR